MRHAYFFTWKRRAVIDGLRSRSRIKIGDPPSDQETKQGYCATLTGLVYDVPHVLEQSDRLTVATKGRPRKKDQVIEMLIIIGSSVARLKKWQLDYTSEIPLRYRSVSTKTFSHFQPLAKGHSGVFPVAYSFINVACERDYRQPIVCLLKLQRAVVNIHNNLQNLWHAASEKAQLQLQLRIAKADIAVCADALCMIAPWMTQPHNTVFGSIWALHLLQDAAEYYEECGNDKRKQLSWCQEVSKALKRLHGIDVCF